MKNSARIVSASSVSREGVWRNTAREREVCVYVQGAERVCVERERERERSTAEKDCVLCPEGDFAP